MKTAFLLLLASLSATAQIGEGTQQTLNVSLSEPTRNCPSITVRVIVSNQQGGRVSGLGPQNFLLSENESPREVSVAEGQAGDYAVNFNAVSTALRMTINVSVRTDRAFGFGSKLTTSCALRVTCGDLPVATVGVPYKGFLQYTVPAGFFNPILSIQPNTPLLKVDPATGELTGQFPTPGNFDFLAFITIAGALDGSFTTQASCQIRINLPPITFTDYKPRSATACSPGFPITVTGEGFQPQLPVPPQQANVGTFLVFDGTPVQGGVLNAARTTLLSPVPDTLLRPFRSSVNVGISTRSAGIQNIDSTLLPFTFKRPPNFAANFTQTSLQAASATGVTVLNVDVLDLDPTTGLRITVGSSSRFLKARSVVGGRLVFDVPNELIAIGGTATIALVNGDEANLEGNAYATSCAPNSARVLTLGPAKPVITSMSPRTATACGPAFPLTINGSSFAVGSTVDWEGSPLLNPEVTATAIKVLVTADRLGTRARTVPVLVALASQPESFVVVAAPALRPLANPTLPIGGPEQTIAATGTDFVVGVTRVRFAKSGSAPQLLATTVQSPTQLTFLLSRALLSTAGAVDLSVVNADEANLSGVVVVVGSTGGSCPVPITASVANPAATVRTLEPSTEIAARQTPLDITINGAGFLEGARVVINAGASQDAVFLSATQLKTTLTVAQLASPGTLRIAVQNPDAAASSALDFTVSAVPVPRFTISANPAAPAAVQDIAISVAQTEAPARQLRATLSLSFEPNADNLPATGLPAAAAPVFAAGGTVFAFDVTGTGGVLPSGALVRPGTVAGTVIIRMTGLTVAGSTVSLLPSPAPEVRVVVPRTAPVIDTVRILPVSGGFEVEILAFSPVRNLTNAIVQVNVVAGTRVESDARFTVDLASRFNDWFRTAENLVFGSQFKVRLPFTLQNGDASIIDSVSVTLTNSVGTSAAVTGRR